MVSDNFLKEYNKVLDVQIKINKKKKKNEERLALLKELYKTADDKNKIKIEAEIQKLEKQFEKVYQIAVKNNKNAKKLKNKP